MASVASSLKIAIIGSGAVGTSLGSNLSKYFTIQFGTRKSTPSPEVLTRCKKENTSFAPVKDASKWADVVILVVPSEAVLATAADIKDEIKGKFCCKTLTFQNYSSN
jgi:predicted dinucleotide-binding enzyme